MSTLGERAVRALQGIRPPKGYLRLSKFGVHLREIIDEYYSDVDLGEMRLNRRLEQMGFEIGQQGGLLIGLDENDNPGKLQAKPE